jgi:uncharacterized protein YjbJ (UPF0337 family)
MRTQETRGKVKQIRGRAKEAVGKVTGDGKLERKGSLERVEGVLEESVGKARRKIGEVLEDVAGAIEK